MSETTRLSGHELQHEGAPHNGRGQRLTPYNVASTGGTGRAKCSCGALSDVLTSGTKRKAWHREHKAQIRAQDAPHVNRDAINGQFVTDEVAQERPETTVRETVRPAIDVKVRLITPHDRSIARAGWHEWWLNGDRAYRDKIGRRGHGTYTWLTVACNAVGCPAEAIVRQAELDEYVGRLIEDVTP